MNTHLRAYETIRDRQLTWGIRALAVIGFPALIISLSRAMEVGWRHIMTLHVGVYLAVVTAAVLQRHLSFFVRACILACVPFVLGIGALISWGLAGFGIPGLIMWCILCALLFGARAGVVSACVSMAAVGGIGFLFHWHHLVMGFDPGPYLTSLGAWGTGMFTIAISAGLIVIALGTMQRQNHELIRELDAKNLRLLRANETLKAEIRQREQLSRERADLEARLQRAQKMEMVATVAGGVAHDLNNVLAGTVSYPDLMLRKLPEDSPLRRPMEIVRKSGLKAAAIVGDLLALVRRGRVSKKTVNLNGLVAEYLKSLEFDRLTAYHPEVAVDTRLDEDLRNIDGVAVHLTKAIMNLVSNGAEAISGSGRVSVATRNRTLHTSVMGYDREIPPGPYVILEVSDTGAGMSREDMERVFEPFYSKKVMGKSGTGLGMTVVWGTVKDHGGYIDIHSRPMQGTVFKIYFPVGADQTPLSETTLPFEDYLGHGESVLVIDDMVEQRDVAAALLTALGYAVTTLPSGEAAVKYLRTHSVDLVVMDMIMDPGMDGLDTYREILKLHPDQKAIIATGYCETDRVKAAQRLGLGSTVLKPLTLENLGEALKAELARAGAPKQ